MAYLKPSHGVVREHLGIPITAEIVARPIASFIVFRSTKDPIKYWGILATKPSIIYRNVCFNCAMMLMFPRQQPPEPIPASVK
jgi:hypothetical protein